MTMIEHVLRRMEFHPLGAAEFSVVRNVLKRDERFRLSHLSPLLFSYYFTRKRRRWIDRTKADVAAVPEDWHLQTPPIFVLGFWRSGTTLLHELLVTDPAFVAPSLIDVLCPADAPYLLRWKHSLVGRMAPLTRGIDKVDVGPNAPQEEELAICNLGAPSFFGVSFFPHIREQTIDEALFLANHPDARLRWSEAHMGFSRLLTAKYPGRRLVLKNPANCTRVPELLSLYPEARFIRIDRSAEDTIASFLRMQAQGDRKFSFQGQSAAPSRELAERFHERVIAKMDADWSTIAADRKAAIRYDELLQNPAEMASELCRRIGLDVSRQAVARRKRYWTARGSLRTPTPAAQAPA